jgi:multimeric flavodoxin WrbA
MKILLINGSPRKNGNTNYLLNIMADVFNNKKIQTEIFQIGGKLVHGCIACGKCTTNPEIECIHKDDVVNDCISKMIESDAIIIGSPTYFGSLTSETKALIDRSGMVTRAKGGLLKRKIGAAVAVERRAGAMQVFNAINDFFLINNMIVTGSSYWNIGVARAMDEMKEDEEGINTHITLAENIIWLLEKIRG